VVHFTGSTSSAYYTGGMFVAVLIVAITADARAARGWRWDYGSRWWRRRP